VQPLMDSLMQSVNAKAKLITPQQPLTEFVENNYLPWCEANKSAATANGYKRIWHCYLKPRIVLWPMS
jgi:hypothetical protein